MASPLRHLMDVQEILQRFDRFDGRFPRAAVEAAVVDELSVFDIGDLHALSVNVRRHLLYHDGVPLPAAPCRLDPPTQWLGGWLSAPV